MKNENTKDRILESALDLFSQKGYAAVSVDEIASKVGIKAPSLYNHFGGKRAIFDGIVNYVAERYEKGSGDLSVHVGDASKDVGVFGDISADGLCKIVVDMFEFSLHDQTIAKFRKMMAIEQFSSSEISAMYNERYFDRLVNYHAALFEKLISAGVIISEDPYTLSLAYTSPLILLTSVCDRQPQREYECIEKLKSVVLLFFRSYNLKK